MSELLKWLFLQHDDVIIMNNYLYYSGVKGMKWGIRKDSKRTNDSSKGLKEASILENKYNADRLLYGNRGSY